MTQVPRKITDDPYGAAALVRRLIADQGLAYWPQYLKAFLLMGVSAAATACSAWLLGEVINQTYINRSVRGIVLLSIAIIVLFALKGLSTYGHTVILSKIGNAILANNQRRLFAKLMRENVGFYAERHSSEFLARLSAGAQAVTQVLNLLVSAVGRDVLSLIGLVTVMAVQDPWMSLFGLVVAPPALIFIRKLVRRIKNPDGVAENIVLPPRLIIRSSCGERLGENYSVNPAKRGTPGRKANGNAHRKKQRSDGGRAAHSGDARP